ncbi:MAG: hypothetical protein PUB18_02405 [bacterium]|nr:hypothetical protein [bacterium]
MLKFLKYFFIVFISITLLILVFNVGLGIIALGICKLLGIFGVTITPLIESIVAWFSIIFMISVILAIGLANT